MGRMLDLLNEVERETRDRGVLEVCLGQTKDGRDFYAFVAIPMDRYPLFLHDCATCDTVSYEEHGQILAIGWGRKPDPVLVEHIKKNLGFEHKNLVSD